MTFILAIAGFTQSEAATSVYKPSKRATSLEVGKQYMLFNCCTVNNGNSYTGFLYDNGSAIAETSPGDPTTFTTLSSSYLFTLEKAGETDSIYNIKTAAGKYLTINVGSNVSTTSTTASNIILKKWAEATKVKKVGTDVKCWPDVLGGESATDYTLFSNVYMIYNGVQTLGNNGAFSGVAGGFKLWETAQPYAFYEVTATEAKADTLSAASTFADSWTATSWTAATNVPAGVTALGYTEAQVKSITKDVYVKEDGNATFTFKYTSGTHKLDIAGVDLVKEDGTVAASDYHYGSTGTASSNNTYTLTGIPAGKYTLRYMAETKEETITSAGTITSTFEDANITTYTGSISMMNAADNTAIGTASTVTVSGGKAYTFLTSYNDGTDNYTIDHVTVNGTTTTDTSYTPTADFTVVYYLTKQATVPTTYKALSGTIATITAMGATLNLEDGDIIALKGVPADGHFIYLNDAGTAIIGTKIGGYTPAVDGTDLKGLFTVKKTTTATGATYQLIASNGRCLQQMTNGQAVTLGDTGAAEFTITYTTGGGANSGYMFANNSTNFNGWFNPCQGDAGTGGYARFAISKVTLTNTTPATPYTATVNVLSTADNSTISTSTETVMSGSTYTFMTTFTNGGKEYTIDKVMIGETQQTATTYTPTGDFTVNYYVSEKTTKVSGTFILLDEVNGTTLKTDSVVTSAADGTYTIPATLTYNGKDYTVDIATINGTNATVNVATPVTAGFIVTLMVKETVGTGINAVGTSKKVTYYDLQGRPVVQPARGLFLVKGKKILK